jgi:hypothetical protein
MTATKKLSIERMQKEMIWKKHATIENQLNEKRR